MKYDEMQIVEQIKQKRIEKLSHNDEKEKEEEQKTGELYCILFNQLEGVYILEQLLKKEENIYNKAILLQWLGNL